MFKNGDVPMYHSAYEWLTLAIRIIIILKEIKTVIAVNYNIILYSCYLAIWKNEFHVVK